MKILQETNQQSHEEVGDSCVATMKSLDEPATKPGKSTKAVHVCACDFNESL